MLLRTYVPTLQVSLPHYRKSGYLAVALERYSRFLQLKKINPGEFLVPCYDIDVVWHAHQVGGVADWGISETSLATLL